MSQPTNETRNLSHYLTSIGADIELRVEPDSRRLVGYAAVFGKESVDLGGFTEVIQRGAFGETLAKEEDIRALVDHQFSLILGRTSGKTLKLEENSIGLKVTIDLPDTSYARDLLENIRHKNVKGMSFGFRVPQGGDKFTVTGDGKVLRTITKVDPLHEVTATSIPAYPDTSLEARIDPSVIQRAAAEVAAINGTLPLALAERMFRLQQVA